MQGVKLLSELVSAWDQERNFIDSGAKVIHAKFCFFFVQINYMRLLKEASSQSLWIKLPLIANDFTETDQRSWLQTNLSSHYWIAYKAV